MERTAELPVRARRPIRGPKRLLRLRADSGLVDLVRAGDDAAFEVLYERHVVGILSFCRHMLRSQEEAEDATQQTFVSAHRDMLRDGRELNFKPWLYTIARNRCLSMLRARREQTSELSGAEVSTAGLQEEVEQRSDLRELVTDVQRLPEEQRAALVLSEVGGLSHNEVADVIGYEPNAVKGLVFRARSALIERRDARQADCQEIREELSTAKGGALRRSHLRYHLEGCPGCVAYLEEVRRQRQLLGVALPAVPTIALHDSVMASAGIGAASAGALGAAASGGVGAAASGGAVATTVGAPLIGGTLAKVALVGVLAVGSAGVATEVVRDGGSDRGSNAPAGVGPGSAGDAAGDGGTGQSGGAAQRSEERSHGARGEERRRRGWERADERSGGRSTAGEPRGKGRGRSDERPGAANGDPGKALGHDKAPVKPPKVKPPSGGGSGQASPKSQGDGGSKSVPERSPPETSVAPDVPPGQAKAPLSE